MKKTWKIALIVFLILAALLGCIWLAFENCVILGGGVRLKNARQLTLSENPVRELDTLKQLPGLVQLDLRKAELTAVDHDTIQAALPNCRIVWTVPFQGGSYPSDIKSIAISSLSQQDLQMMEYFTDLETVDALQCQDYEMLVQLQQARPACDVQFQVTVGGRIWPRDTEKLTAPNATVQELAVALISLPKLQEVNVTGCQDYAQLMALQSQYPQCVIHYSVPIGGRMWQENTQEIRLYDADGQEVLQMLPYLPKLSSAVFVGRAPDEAVMAQMMALRPDVTYNWNFTLEGQTVNSLDTELDFSGIPLDSVETVEAALKFFPNLQTVNMSGCGIANEEMDAFRNRHPEIKIVWTVQMGSVSLRTDITALAPFSTYGLYLDDSRAQELRYCTDLVCLDLGHLEKLTDLSFLENMTKLEYLVLGATWIEDISVCANMPELRFLELFQTWVSDLTPLYNCPKLEDLNIGYAPLVDIAQLPKMQQLKHLWVSNFYLDEAQEKWLQEAMPNTEMFFKTPSSTAGGWRRLPNYYKMRDLLGLPYMKDWTE